MTEFPETTVVIEELKDLFPETSWNISHLYVIFNMQSISSQEQSDLTYPCNAWIQLNMKSWGKNWLKF